MIFSALVSGYSTNRPLLRYSSKDSSLDVTCERRRIRLRRKSQKRNDLAYGKPTRRFDYKQLIDSVAAESKEPCTRFSRDNRLSRNSTKSQHEASRRNPHRQCRSSPFHFLQTDTSQNLTVASGSHLELLQYATTEPPSRRTRTD